MIRLLALAVVVGLSFSVVRAEDLKSGPGEKIGGAFQVKAITGENKGDTLCYVCKYNAEARPAVVLVFTQKADENLAKVVKAVDEVQKNNAKLGTVVVGVSGVAAADFEKLQTTHKLTTPLDRGRRQGRPRRLQAEQGRGRHRARLQEGWHGRPRTSRSRTPRAPPRRPRKSLTPPKKP